MFNKSIHLKDDGKPQKFPLKFDLPMMNMIIGYLYKDTNQINRKCLVNMRNLFDFVDEELYNANPKLASRLYIIIKTLDARVNKGFENWDLIKNYAVPDIEDNDINAVMDNLDEYTRINYDEIAHITKVVSDRLQYIHLFTYKEQIYETIEKLDSGDFRSYEDINTQLTSICRTVIQNTRAVEVNESANTFSLSSEMFVDEVHDIVKKLKDATKLLTTGIRAWNDLLSGGYFSKRLYIYVALPANFKSGILLKSARDIKQYNKGIKTKTGKRPTVLLVTMENTVEETVERLFSMTSSDKDIRSFTPNQVVKLLKETGELTIRDEDDIDIVIKYYSTFAISTDDLYTIMDDMEDEGKECIALIVDYIKRIRPALWAKEEKEQLKNVTNELRSLAVEKDIPVISAHQVNRAGATAVDAAQISGKEDLTRFIGRGNVGSA